MFLLLHILHLQSDEQMTKRGHHSAEGRLRKHHHKQVRAFESVTLFCFCLVCTMEKKSFYFSEIVLILFFKGAQG